jgi:cobalt-zinc-cadmium efflux system membrane fusion protein
MKQISNIMSILLVAAAFAAPLISCSSRKGSSPKAEAVKGAEAESDSVSGGMTDVTLTSKQAETLGLEVDTIGRHSFAGGIEVNGQLESLPQNEASVTAFIGANVASIVVREGQRVARGQVLAYVSHPDLLELQSKYVSACSELDYTSGEYQRQKRLYDENVGSGKDYEKTQSEYKSLQGEVRNLEAQLRLLRLDPARIKAGTLYERVPIVAPIPGYIDRIEAKIGQYVDPQTSMFQIVDNSRIQAHLMAFEKDAYKIKEGQTVTFTVESAPGQTFSAKVYSVGKTFEENPKAVRVHAEIDNRKGLLIAGTYIKGKIAADVMSLPAVPEDAVATSCGKTYVFLAARTAEGWKFTPVEVSAGRLEDGFVEVAPASKVPVGSRIAQNCAYYILSEMKKAETGEED